MTAPTSRARRRPRVLRMAAIGTAIGVVIFVAMVVIGRHASYKSTEGCHSSAPRLSILMIGNSYTSKNNLGAMLAKVLCESEIATNVQVDALTAGGARLTRWTGSGTKKHLRGHDVVVIQDQSQIPGFGAGSAEFRKSQDALDELAQAATEARVHVVLFQTWAHRNGDARNRDIYPDFEEMQSALVRGYDDYLQALKGGPAPDAEVSRVGEAWARVLTSNPGVFVSLYASDGSHPSRAGTYLAALVLAETISHHGLPASTWRPADLTAREAQIIQAAARIA